MENIKYEKNVTFLTPYEAYGLPTTDS